MVSVILLSLLIVAVAAVLFHMFNESKLEIDSPTIAAMEARTEALEARRRDEQQYDQGPASTREDEEFSASQDEYENEAEPEALPPVIELSEYEYRELLEEAGGNYVLPQWVLNFFSSSDICHTLDPSDNVVIITKLSDPKNAEAGSIDISVDCDMTTQTVALKVCFGHGAAAEDFKTKFYLFERGDLFELGRLARQDDVRIDILTRAADYTLEYVCTLRTELTPSVLAQLKKVLARMPA